MSTFHLKIIAYDKIFYDDEAASVVLPAIDGEVQILTNHEECVVALKEGEVRIGTTDGKMIPAVCGSGFAEVNSDNQVEILVDTIERPEEIDVRRAKEAKERAGRTSASASRAVWSIIAIPHHWPVQWHV